jgi:hypothetical protein
MSEKHDDEQDVCRTDIPEEMDHNKNIEPVDRSACRDAVTGRFTKGWKGGGRPVGSKDRFSVAVMEALEATFHDNKEELLTTLAAEKPDVFMGLIAKLLPTAVIQDDMMGETEKAEGNQEVRITLVHQAQEPALPEPAREVEGELLPETTH